MKVLPLVRKSFSRLLISITLLSSSALCHAASSADTQSVRLSADELTPYTSTQTRTDINVPLQQTALLADNIKLDEAELELYPVLYFGNLVSQTTGASISNSTFGNFDIRSIASQTGLKLSSSKVGSLAVDSIYSSTRGISVESSDTGSIIGKKIVVTSSNTDAYAIHAAAYNKSIGFDQTTHNENSNNDQGKISIDMHAVSTSGSAYGVFVQFNNTKLGALRGEVEIYARGCNQGSSYAWYDVQRGNYINVLADEGVGSQVTTHGNIYSYGVRVDEGSYMKMVDVGHKTQIFQYDIQGALDIVISHQYAGDVMTIATGNDGFSGAENIRVFGGVLDVDNVCIKISEILDCKQGFTDARTIGKDVNHTLVFDSADGTDMVMSFDVNSSTGASISNISQVQSENSLGWEMSLTLGVDDALMMSLYVGDLLSGLSSEDYMLYHLDEQGNRIELSSSQISYFEDEGLLHFSIEHQDTNNGSINGPIMLDTLQVIPEPSSAMMSLLALLSFCGYRRRHS